MHKGTELKALSFQQETTGRGLMLSCRHPPHTDQGGPYTNYKGLKLLTVECIIQGPDQMVCKGNSSTDTLLS